MKHLSRAIFVYAFLSLRMLLEKEDDEDHSLEVNFL